ncbi:MAG: ACP S-malonyltransferase [Caldimicrobium sp.]|jgi:[acyl-carrier-protein] S-malonyltransferase
MVALVFPGQGSQYLGMGKDCALFERAELITGIPVKRLSLEGPPEELTKTENLQVCLTLVNICAFEYLKELLGEAFKEKVRFTAGHSLGEFSALYASSVLSFEDTLQAVKKRGEIMGREGGERPSGMYAVINMPEAELKELIRGVKGLVLISNYNSPRQLVISGEEPALTEVAERAKEKGAKVVRLKVSAGFHSPLMKRAEEEFSKFLDTLEFKDAEIPFVSNVSARAEREGKKIKELLKKQMTSPVRWIEVVEYIYSQGVNTFIELGPKQVLKGLISQILEGKPFRCYSGETREDIEKVLREII